MVNFSFLEVILSIIVFSQLGLIYFFFRKFKKNIQKEIESLKLEIKQQKSTSSFEAENLKNRIKMPQIDNISSTKDLQNNSNSSNTENKEFEYTDKPPREVIFEINSTKYLFLPSPFDDKKFSVEDSSTERKSSSLFCITLGASEKEGKLHILEDADFSKALNSPDLFLAKACIYENSFDFNAISIENVKKGSVYLEGQDWIVKEKVKVKFLKR